MDRLSYRQSLWPMTDEQIEKEYNEKSNWKNMDDLELFREVESEHGKRKYRQEQKMNRKKEEDRTGRIIADCEEILNKWVEKGMEVKNGAYYYKDELMFAGLGISSKHIDKLILELRSIDKNFQIELEEQK